MPSRDFTPCIWAIPKLDGYMTNFMSWLNTKLLAAKKDIQPQLRQAHVYLSWCVRHHHLGDNCSKASERFPNLRQT